MGSLTRRVVAFVRTERFTTLWRYAAVSVISTVLTLVVLFLTYHVWRIGSAMECNVLATAVSAVPSYYLNRTWAWGKTGRSHVLKEVVPFWVIAFAGLVLSTVAVGVAAHNADRITHSSLGRAILVEFANFFTYGVIWVGKFLIFNRFLFSTTPEERAVRRGLGIRRVAPVVIVAPAEPQGEDDALAAER
jgi:putative flippase GtrA